MDHHPAMMTGVDTVDPSYHHLHYLSCYISRLRAFSEKLGSPLKDFVDSDLGGCFLGCLPLIEREISARRDNTLNSMWRDFVSATEQFQTFKPQVQGS
ncbi:hypothetical protein [Luteolibacter marinus]|uniref:hypothetical protein n=1 Tax=Luteolibacter marinus TaxID=2776705 RepID=UPI001865AA9C|nr:hypothetical protein [Luteolibacter marinus]